MYHNCHLESKLLKLSKVAKVILVLGARQVGKSTILKKHFPNILHITFERLTLKSVSNLG